MTAETGGNTRRSIRLRGYDYSQEGAYFVTSCTKNRGCIFGEVVDGVMQLSAQGEIAAECWLAIGEHFPHVTVDCFVIMPNHVHGILILSGGSAGGMEEMDPVGGAMRAQPAAPLRSSRGRQDGRGHDGVGGRSSGGCLSFVGTTAQPAAPLQSSRGRQDGRGHDGVGGRSSVEGLSTVGTTAQPAAPLQSWPWRPDGGGHDRVGGRSSGGDVSTAGTTAQPAAPLRSQPWRPDGGGHDGVGGTSSGGGLSGVGTTAQPAAPLQSSREGHVGAHGQRAPWGRVAPGSLGAIVRSFKSAVTKRLREVGLADGPVWQRNYFEHVLRDDASLLRCREYILDNPAKWAFDRENPAAARSA